MLPAASETAPIRNRRIQASAAGEKICAMSPASTGLPRGLNRVVRAPVPDVSEHFDRSEELADQAAVVTTGAPLSGQPMAASSHPNDYERSDAAPWLIASIALGIAVFLLATPFVIRAGYPWAIRQAGIRDLPRPPAPRLEVKPGESLAALHAREDIALSHYGWADRQHGVVRIPIDRAAALLAERGLPGWPSQTADSK